MKFPLSLILGHIRHNANFGELGFLGLGIGLIIALLFGGVLLTWTLASISWKGILAVFAMGIVAMSVAGALFFKADWKYVMMASVVAMALVFIIEVSFPVLIGGIMVVLAMWNFKILAKRPVMFALIIGLGLLVMMITYRFAIMGGLI